jgi:hypothetical protein
MKILSRCAAGFYGCALEIISGTGELFRHARTDGHPAIFPVQAVIQTINNFLDSRLRGNDNL